MQLSSSDVDYDKNQMSSKVLFLFYNIKGHLTLQAPLNR